MNSLEKQTVRREPRGVSIPFDLAAASSLSDWRRRVRWPIAQGDLLEASSRVLERYLAICRRLDEANQAVALLAGHNLLSIAAYQLSTAVCLSRAATEGIPIAGESPIYRFLSGDGDDQTLTGESARSYFFRNSALRYPFLRRIARIGSWTTPVQLVRAIIRPQHTAITHNILLCTAARKAGTVGFKHADIILDGARQHHVVSSSDVEALCVTVVEGVLEGNELLPAVYDRLAALLKIECNNWFHLAATDLAGLKETPDLPLDVWSGTGGNWAARAIGLEVLRRGGKVTRFSHGGKDGFLGVPEPLAFLELCVSSSYMLSTKRASEIADRQALHDAAILRPKLNISGLDGNPIFRKVPRMRSEKRGPRPRVVFCGNVLLGQRQIFPPLLPDVVSLNFQLEVAENLNEWPIELVCKPHPEGYFVNKLHPMADIAPVSQEPFETFLTWADILIFDWAESTPFWKSLCTDRPIILLDLGLTKFSESARKKLENRCAIIEIKFDADNRPIAPIEQLRELVFSLPETIDTWDFRQLLAGDE